MDDLQCLLPTHQPCVSDHMDQIRDMIAKVRITFCLSYICLGQQYLSISFFFVKGI